MFISLKKGDIIEIDGVRHRILKVCRKDGSMILETEVIE